MGRHGTVFTPTGKVQVTKSSYRTDRRPLVDTCPCPACTQYDRAYLRHLHVTEEPLGPRMLALHNLTFLLELMRDARAQLRAGTFAGWSAEWLARYRDRSRSQSRGKGTVKQRYRPRSGGQRVSKVPLQRL
jgi:queuine tRNA-ribosyltransferase